MRRHARRFSLLAFLLAGAVGPGVELASADAPVKEGWWSKANTAPPPPSRDGSSSDGLVVSREAYADARHPLLPPSAPQVYHDGIVAVAALYFEVPVGADAVLELFSADGKPITLPPGSGGEVSGSVVLACKATKPWVAEKNAAFSRAPTWDDSFCFSGAFPPDNNPVVGPADPATNPVENEANNTSLVWELPSTMQNEDGSYDVVIVPSGTAAYTVQFAPTAEDTLSYTEPPPEPPEPDPDPDPPEPPEPDPDPDDDVILAGPVAVPAPDGTYSSPEPGASGARAAALARSNAPRGRRGPVGVPDTRAERVMASVMLFVMGMALWWLGGAPARLPRPVLALVGRGRDQEEAPADEGPPRRGIGRFVRERGGRPPRL